MNPNPMPLEQLRGGLIVSCQAYPAEPLRTPEAMTLMAQAAAHGGAAGIRAQGLADIRGIHTAVDLPLIGLWKDGDGDVMITPTLEHATALAQAGADIVALDATARPRPDGRTLAETMRILHQDAGVLVMADIATHAEGMAAAEAGADVLATTLSGYTGGAAPPVEPDLELVRTLAASVSVPVVSEGRIHRPGQVAAALNAGAHAVVVGTAITHPTTLTRWFVAATAHGDDPATDQHATKG